jgi:NADH-quinone oxidoreductase subunit M
MLPLFNDPVNFEQFMPVAATLCLLSVIFAALMAISQSDLKRIVAYSSIAHMNFSLLGLLSMSDRAVIGGTILFIAHGFVSAGMFFSVGMIYDRYHQRDLLYYRGLAGVAPLFAVLYFLLNLANLGVPLSFNFLGEFLIFAEIMNIYHFAAPLLIIALIIQVGYTMKLVSILFGETINFANAPKLIWSDLALHEFIILSLLVVPAYYFGIRGENFIDLMILLDPLLNHADIVLVDQLEHVLGGKQLVIDV